MCTFRVADVWPIWSISVADIAVTDMVVADMVYLQPEDGTPSLHRRNYGSFVLVHCICVYIVLPIHLV